MRGGCCFLALATSIAYRPTNNNIYAAARRQQPLSHSAERYRMATLHRTDCWRQCMGLCCICGQPLASPPLFRTPSSYSSSRLAMRNLTDDEIADAADDNNNNNNQSTIDSDGRLLAEEDPARIALLRFNALGEFQFAHIVDDYTFLEGRRNGVLFRNEFLKHQKLVAAAHPEAMALFKATVLDAPDARVYNAAVTTMRRVAENLTIPACKRCNKAMDREGSHVGATYRCFAVTRDSDVPQLEGTSKEAIAAKKVIQQIAIYFEPVLQLSPTPKTAATPAAASATHPRVQAWLAKPEDRLLREATLWRCIAHLSNWGRAALGEGVRFRMVAVFHASHYIYLGSSMRDVLPFESWHVHIWRPFYMHAYRPTTFLGMRQSEAGLFFDLSRKHGAEWQRMVKARADAVAAALEAFHSPPSFASAAAYARGPRPEDDDDAIIHNEEEDGGSSSAAADAIIQYEEAMVRAGVSTEAQLMQFLAEKHAHGSVGKAALCAGLTDLLRFFRYNLGGGNGAGFLLRQCDVLQRELIKALAPPRQA